MKPSPVAKTLRSFLLPGSLRPVRHGTSPRPFSLAGDLRRRLPSPAGVPSRRSLYDRFRVATMRFATRRPQGFVPPRSPLRPRSVSAAHRSMLPWVLGRHVSDAAARFRAAQTCWAFRRASKPAGVPVTRTSRGRQSVSALSGSGVDAGLLTRRSVAAGVGACDPKVAAFRRRPCGSPKGTAGIDRIVAPAPPERGTSAASQPPRRAARTQVDPPEGNPRIGPDRPKAIGFRCRPRRFPERRQSDPAADPEGRRRGSSSCSPSFRGCPRTTGEPARRRLPPPEGIGRPRATRHRHPGGCCVEPYRATPEGIAADGRTGRPPEGGSLTVHGSGGLQQAGAPVSGQTDIVLID